MPSHIPILSLDYIHFRLHAQSEDLVDEATVHGYSGK